MTGTFTFVECRSYKAKYVVLLDYHLQGDIITQKKLPHIVVKLENKAFMIYHVMSCIRYCLIVHEPQPSAITVKNIVVELPELPIKN